MAPGGVCSWFGWGVAKVIVMVTGNRGIVRVKLS